MNHTMRYPRLPINYFGVLLYEDAAQPVISHTPCAEQARSPASTYGQ